MERKHLLVSAGACFLAFFYAVNAFGQSVPVHASSLVLSVFSEFDLDEDQRLDEMELYLALSFLREKRLGQLQDRAARGDESAARAIERISQGSQDPTVGTPSLAAAFLVANFDEDEDWELDSGEATLAFDALKRWRQAPSAY